MAAFVSVRNMRKDPVTLALPGEDLREVGKHGARDGSDVIRVTPEQAGRPPSWRKPRDGDPVHMMDVERDEQTGEVVQVLDLGEGLLAQFENWEIVDEPAAPAGGDTKGGDS